MLEVHVWGENSRRMNVTTRPNGCSSRSICARTRRARQYVPRPTHVSRYSSSAACSLVLMEALSGKECGPKGMVQERRCPGDSTGSGVGWTVLAVAMLRLLGVLQAPDDRRALGVHLV